MSLLPTFHSRVSADEGGSSLVSPSVLLLLKLLLLELGINYKNSGGREKFVDNCILDRNPFVR